MILEKSSSGVWRWAGYAVLAVLIVVMYAPSLYHVARGDQINYLAELSSRHGFGETVFGTFDLNRTRLFGAGDELAFRPVLYVILGLEKYLFGYHFMAWQAFGILAHLVVCAALYTLLCRIRGGMFAVLGTGLFATAVINIEAVTWHHITPYLLFAGCVLMALRHLYMVQEEASGKDVQAWAALAWMVPAVFLYETGVWYAVCMAVFLNFHARRRVAAGMMALVVLYMGLNAADLFWRHAGAALQARQVLDHGSLMLTLGHAALLGKWFLSAFFFLAPQDLAFVSRTMVRPELVGWMWPWGQPLTLVLVVGIITLVTVIVMLARRGTCGGFLLLCLAMAAGYLGVIALGRINVLGEFGLRVGLYYAYNFLLLAMVVAALMSSGEWPLLVKGVGACILAGVIVFNGVMTHQVTAQMAREHTNNRMFLEALDRYVNAHEQESGFSFYVGPEYPGNYVADWVSRRGDVQGRLYTVAEALYPSKFTRDRPKYVIKFTH